MDANHDPRMPQFIDADNVHQLPRKPVLASSFTPQAQLNAVMLARNTIADALVVAGFHEKGRGYGGGTADVALSVNGLPIEVRIYVPERS